jgi:hypothetical protein
VSTSNVTVDVQVLATYNGAAPFTSAFLRLYDGTGTPIPLPGNGSLFSPGGSLFPGSQVSLPSAFQPAAGAPAQATLTFVVPYADAGADAGAGAEQTITQTIPLYHP